jgi:NAD(P)-dependent dehydrogenase (short-subunit alcohol dehydrogenase family)
VTLPQADIDAIVTSAIAIYGHIDVLVNNAGYIELGLAEGTSYVVEPNLIILLAAHSPQFQ